MEEKQLTRAQLFRQRHSKTEYVSFTTDDGLEWTMIKPSNRFFFDLFIKRDITIGALNVETDLDEEGKLKLADPTKVEEQAKRVQAVYQLMRSTLIEFSHLPKIVDSGVEPSDQEISLDDFPSFEYMSEVFNKLVSAAGVPVNEAKDTESFRT